MNPSNSPGNNSSLSRSALETIRSLLFARRRDLEDSRATQLNELADPGDKHHLADLEEMTSDSGGVESLCEIIDMEEATVAQIDAALEKIDEGSYGICESCETSIPRERLEALPFAGRCIECQRQEELRIDA